MAEIKLNKTLLHKLEDIDKGMNVLSSLLKEYLEYVEGLSPSSLESIFDIDRISEKNDAAVSLWIWRNLLKVFKKQLTTLDISSLSLWDWLNFTGFILWKAHHSLIENTEGDLVLDEVNQDNSSLSDLPSFSLKGISKTSLLSLMNVFVSRLLQDTRKLYAYKNNSELNLLIKVNLNGNEPK